MSIKIRKMKFYDCYMQNDYSFNVVCNTSEIFQVANWNNI